MALTPGNPKLSELDGASGDFADGNTIVLGANGEPIGTAPGDGPHMLKDDPVVGGTHITLPSTDIASRPDPGTVGEGALLWNTESNILQVRNNATQWDDVGGGDATPELVAGMMIAWDEQGLGSPPDGWAADGTMNAKVDIGPEYTWIRKQ